MKRIVLILCLVFAFILGACMPIAASAEQTYPLKIWKQNENGAYKTFCVVDDATGVNYVVASISRSGSHECAISITPRLNADGSLYVTN